MQKWNIEDEEIVSFVIESGGNTTHDIAENFGVWDKTAKRKLFELEDKKKIKHKKFGRNYIWFSAGSDVVR